MTPSSKSRLPIYVGAWLATAVATFSLGRITANSLQDGRGGSAAARKALSPASSSEVAGPGQGANGEVGSDDLLARMFGGHASSLEQVLVGRTLEDHVKHLLKQDDEATRMLGFLRLLEALDNADDIKKTLEIIAKENGGRFRMTEQSMLLQKWAQMDPKAAAAFANSQRDFSRFTGMNAVLRTWLKANPDEAIAWAQENGAPSGEQGDRGFGGRGPGGPDDGNWAIATMIGPLAEKNLDRALKLAADQPVSRARGRMIDTLVDQMIAQRGDDMARNAISDMTDDAFRAGMAGRLADKMASSDPQKAGEWAKNLPAGATRERALSEVVSQWVQKDVVAAGQYLQGLPNSPDLDDARQEYSRFVGRQDPQAAMPWAQTITDPKQQAEAVQRVLRDWVRVDPAGAQTWGAANGVTVPQATPQNAQGGGNFGFRGGRRGN